MDPLLDVAPPEKRVGRSITRGRLWEGLETTKVFAGLLRRFAAAGPADTLSVCIQTLSDGKIGTVTDGSRGRLWNGLASVTITSNKLAFS